MAIQFYLLINSRRLSANIEIRNCRFSLKEDAFIIHKNISDISTNRSMYSFIALQLIFYWEKKSNDKHVIIKENVLEYVVNISFMPLN